MPFGGYWAKDGSYVRDMDKPIYNEATLDAMRRDREKADVDSRRAREMFKKEEEARRGRIDREIAKRQQEENERRRQAEARERAWEETRQIHNRVHDVKMWLQRNAFVRLINMVNGKSKKFKSYSKEIYEEREVDVKQDLLELMEKKVGYTESMEKGRSR